MDIKQIVEKSKPDLYKWVKETLNKNPKMPLKVPYKYTKNIERNKLQCIFNKIINELNELNNHESIKFSWLETEYYKKTYIRRKIGRKTETRRGLDKTVYYEYSIVLVEKNTSVSNVNYVEFKDSLWSRISLFFR
jgi:hypothetical protein